MNTEESAYKTRLVAQAKKLGAYARRFEDQFAVGILDVLVAFRDLPVCLCECKIIRGRAFGPTERQWIEGNRVLAVHGHIIPVLVGWHEDDGRMYVGDWAKSIPMRACRSQQEHDNFALTLWSYLNERQRTGEALARRSH